MPEITLTGAVPSCGAGEPPERPAAYRDRADDESGHLPAADGQQRAGRAPGLKLDEDRWLEAEAVSRRWTTALGSGKEAAWMS